MGFRITSIIFAILIVISCSNGDRCYESTDTFLVTTIVGNSAIPIDSLLVRGAGRKAKGDTLLLDKTASVFKKIALPLALSADSTGFDLVANGKSQTFWIRHTMNMQLVSASCGFAPYYQLTGSRHTSLIDSIRFSDLSADPKSVERHTTNGQNVTIYLHLTAH